MPRRNALRIGATFLSIAGGALLVIGPFLVWASVNADAHAFAAALHETVPQIQPAVQESTGDYTWLEGNAHGAVGELAGVVVFLVAATTVRRPTMAAGAALIVLGLFTGWLALANPPNPDTLRREAVSTASPWASAMHVDRDVLLPVFEVRQGRSRGVCAIGGLAASIGGLLVVLATIRAREEVPDSAPWTGFRARTPGSSTS